MICIIHYKLNTCCNLTELPDDEFVPAPWIKVSYMAFKIRICNIGKITYQDVRILNSWFHIDFFIIAFYRMDHIWIRFILFFHGVYLCKSRLDSLLDYYHRLQHRHAIGLVPAFIISQKEKNGNSINITVLFWQRLQNVYLFSD